MHYKFLNIQTDIFNLVRYQILSWNEEFEILVVVHKPTA